MKCTIAAVSILILVNLTTLALAQSHIIAAIKQTDPLVVLQDGTITTDVQVNRKWVGSFCTTTLTNTGQTDVRIKEVVLLQAAQLFGGDTEFYAEGFQMLSQYNGTLANPKNIGSYDDNGHYKLPQPAGYKAVYNMLILKEKNGGGLLMGFNSSFRFIGKFYLSADTVKVVMDMDNVLLKADHSEKLEEFSMFSSRNINSLTSRFANRINKIHPRLQSKNIPDGWCSWYCFGPGVTATNIRDNLSFIKQKIPQLKYIQLDDGYQPHMGDWLETGSSFGGNIKAVLKDIKKAGFEPALWVAPFICDKDSRIFKEHTDWLVRDSAGNPLRSDKVSFGGWRLGPWYVLDGTHPQVQQHLTRLFKTMTTEWGITYFKLDANFWGTIPGGVYYDGNTTRVSAYRNGMTAILKGAGNAFVLGCNHPLWPSLGLVHGSRSSNDINRDWKNIVTTGDENLHRAWQNGKLWWNDPDCILLTGDLSDDEFMYHASLLFATGGMMLSGDDLTKLPPQRLAILKKMVPAKGLAASFDDSLQVGWIKTRSCDYLILLNKTDEAKAFEVPLIKAYSFIDYWTDEKKGTHRKSFNITLPPHAGRVYKLEAL